MSGYGFGDNACIELTSGGDVVVQLLRAVHQFYRNTSVRKDHQNQRHNEQRQVEKYRIHLPDINVLYSDIVLIRPPAPTLYCSSRDARIYVSAKSRGIQNGGIMYAVVLLNTAVLTVSTCKICLRE